MTTNQLDGWKQKATGRVGQKMCVVQIRVRFIFYPNRLSHLIGLFVAWFRLENGCYLFVKLNIEIFVGILTPIWISKFSFRQIQVFDDVKSIVCTWKTR